MPNIQACNFSTDEQVRATFKNRRYLSAIHIHQFAEIVYIMEGEITVKHYGKSEIAKAGDIVFIPPYQPHGFYTEDNNKVNFWMLLFSDSFMLDIIHNKNAYLGYNSTVFKPSAELEEFLRSKMFDTGEELVDLNFEGMLNLKAILFSVFSEYFAKKQSTSQKETLLNNEAIFSDSLTKTLNYLQNNFCHDISIKDCAKKIGYSESHISHCLKKHLQMTFLTLLNKLRVRYAERLLRYNRMSIYMVGLECGFNCEQTFKRVFKKITNLTPLEFRKKHMRPTLK